MRAIGVVLGLAVLALIVLGLSALGVVLAFAMRDHLAYDLGWPKVLSVLGGLGTSLTVIAGLLWLDHKLTERGDYR